MSASETKRRLYLDHNATTPVSARAVQALLPYLEQSFGNPSSIHAEGVLARAAVERARDQTARALGVRAAEIVFTSGCTESINAALRGIAAAHPEKKRIVTSAVEHTATLDVLAHLEESGYEVLRLPVDRSGRLDPTIVAAALDERTACLSLLWVNNETGVFFDIGAIGAIARRKGVPFHVDGAQIVGKGLENLGDAPVDCLSFSGHKFGAPKGVGGLYIRRNAPVKPFLWGGHHEKGRRAGTENVPGIVAMGEAVGEATEGWRRYGVAIGRRRDRLAQGLRDGCPGLIVNGEGAPRIENTLNVCFPGIEGAAVVLSLSQRGIFVSSGSACTAAQAGPSHVLVAMGVPGDKVHGSVRFSLGAEIDDGDIDRVIAETRAVFLHVSRVNTA